MSGRQMDEDASIADLPWASVFDPAANVRALSAIQARGFRAATEVVDRFVRMAARGFDGPPGTSDPGEGDRGDSNFPEASEMLASWQTMMGQLGKTVVSAAAVVEPGLDLTNSAANGEMRLDVSGPGVAVTELWLHNRGSSDMGTLRMRASDLLAHDGMVFPAQRLQFEPAVLEMPARCSRGIVLEADVSSEYAPGHYRGTILVDGHADAWLPVDLHITVSTP
jgi:hypothetical protein